MREREDEDEDEEEEEEEGEPSSSNRRLVSSILRPLYDLVCCFAFLFVRGRGNLCSNLILLSLFLYRTLKVRLFKCR